MIKANVKGKKPEGLFDNKLIESIKPSREEEEQIAYQLLSKYKKDPTFLSKEVKLKEEKKVSKKGESLDIVG